MVGRDPGFSPPLFSKKFKCGLIIGFKWRTHSFLFKLGVPSLYLIRYKSIWLLLCFNDCLLIMIVSVSISLISNIIIYHFRFPSYVISLKLRTTRNTGFKALWIRKKILYLAHDLYVGDCIYEQFIQKRKLGKLKNGLPVWRRFAIGYDSDRKCHFSIMIFVVWAFFFSIYLNVPFKSNIWGRGNFPEKENFRENSAIQVWLS